MHLDTFGIAHGIGGAAFSDINGSLPSPNFSFYYNFMILAWGVLRRW